MTARHRKPTRGPFERVRRFFGFGPEFDPDSTATQRIEDGTSALLSRAEGLGIATPRRDPDAIMGLTDEDFAPDDRADRLGKLMGMSDEEITNRKAAHARALADLDAQTQGRATASGRWSDGETRRRETLDRMKRNRGYSADQKSNAAHHNEDTFRGVGEYNDPSSPYTDPTQ